jgi:ankyrin repeat protein
MLHRAPKHDIEEGKPADSMSSKDETHVAVPLANAESKYIQKPASNALKKILFFKYHDKSKKTTRKPIPNDLDLTTLTHILRNMVAANDVDGVNTVLNTMQTDRKSDGFTIQNLAGDGLLQIAALKDFEEMTKLLLQKGFDINYVDDNHGTALQAAIYMDSSKVVNVLCNNKMIKANTVGGYYGCALQVAAFKGSLDYIDKLVQLGMKKDVYVAKSKYGTALQAAARTGSTKVLKRILALDATQINKVGGAWGTALQAAAKGDYTEATAKLRQLSRGRVLEQASEKDRKKGGEAPEYLEVAKILLDKGAEVNVDPSGRLQTPINAAASSGQYEMLKLLLERDKAPDDDERKRNYGRALLSAITQTSPGDKSNKPDKADITDQINKNRLLLVTELVSRNAEIDFVAGNCLHNRPLAAAAAMNDVKVVGFLLEKKGNDQKFMDIESGIHGSALRAALSATPPAKDTALFLIKKGADTKMGDEHYGNILHLAAFANLPDIVSILLNENKQAVNVLDKNYQTALHIAAYGGYVKVAEILLKESADANLKDVWGNIPLDIVGGVIERESHPVPSLQGLRQIRELLLKESECKTEQQVSGPFPGPGVSKQIQPLQPESERPTAKSVYELPKWNPGLKFHAKIVDFLAKDQQEYVLVKDLGIDELLYKTGAMEDTMKLSDKTYERKLRWIHLPTNNVCHTVHIKSQTR